MALIDFDKLSKEFDGVDDFGFSAVSEEEYKAVITNADGYKMVNYGVLNA